VGNGPAFNISIEAGNVCGQGKLNFFHSDVLAGNEIQVLHLTLRQPETERQMFTHDDIVTNIAQGHLPPTLPLTILYTGANGQAYTTMMSIEVRSELLCYQFGKHTPPS
jgi:hypothetical protein